MGHHLLATRRRRTSETLFVLGTAIFSGFIPNNPEVVGSEQRPSSVQYDLQTGWNLLSFPFETNNSAHRALVSEGLAFWPVALRNNTGYWVWSKAPRQLHIDGSRKKDIISQANGAAGWHFLGVPKPVVFKPAQAARAIRWDAKNQAFLDLEEGDTFLPGLGYWVSVQGLEALAPKKGAHKNAHTSGPNTPDILLFHSHRLTVYEGTFWLRGSVFGPNPVSLFVQSSSGEATPVHIVDEFFEAEVALKMGENTFVLTASDHAGNSASKRVVMTQLPEMAPLKRPRPPSSLAATASLEGLGLWWTPPTLFEDGTAIPPGVVPFFRIYRDDELIKEAEDTSDHTMEANEPGRPHRYSVTAVLQNRSGATLESLPSRSVSLPSLPTPAPKPGSFEPPVVLAKEHAVQEQPQTALTHYAGKTYAYVAFVSQDQTTGQRTVNLSRSPKAGKPGSFGPPQPVYATQTSGQVRGLALSAKGADVSVAWIETHPKETSGSSEVYVSNSTDGGQSFGNAVLIRQNKRWKRGIDVAFDDTGQHHLVWGEANKVYYLKNLTGAASNVFDVRKREAATERVKYKVLYEPDKKAGCRCEACWCAESYALTEAPYVYRVEESYVYEPSLHIDDQSINIIARQERMWDNRPVANPQWTAMFFDPVYSDEIIERLRPTKLVLGWRSTWKRAYEANDDTLWDNLGHQHQYRYQGTWHPKSQIKIAQRPVDAHRWSEPKPHPWTPGVWRDNTQSDWRISVAFETDPAEFAGRPSHPQAYTGPGGEMVVVFEQGISARPRARGHNPIMAVASHDGGLGWSPAVVVGQGYTPQVATASTGEIQVLFYKAGPPSSGPSIQSVRRAHGGRFTEATTVSTLPQRPLPKKSRGPDATALADAPSLSTHDALFFAAWVQQEHGNRPRADQVVTARASEVAEFSHWDVARSGRTNKTLTVTAQNKFHMRVDTQRTLPITNPNAHDSSHPFAPQLNNARTAPITEPHALTLGHGVTQVSLAAAAGHSNPAHAFFSTALLKPANEAAFESPDTTVLGSVRNNYAQAITLRDTLLKRLTHEETGRISYAQREYQASGDIETATERPEADLETLDHQDAHYLAGFHRAWAYTQGITLAQLAKASGDYTEEAWGLAQTLCDRAVRKKNGKTIKGWPFSWNTLDDDWQDARLVTGANAWVIQGLAVFIASPRFFAAQAADQQALKRCFQDALEGLNDHRRRITLEDGRIGSLMTAGWTTEGLQQASALHRLSSRKAFAHFDASVHAAYYSILDAIGYSSFAPTSIRICSLQTGTPCNQRPVNDPAWETYPITDETEWAALKKPALASNVVTEHNLDVLSVLNYAVLHADALGPIGSEARRHWADELESWRDEVRDATFTLLWDDQGWRQEFEKVLAEKSFTPTGRTLTENQTHNHMARMRAMEDALESNTLGRMVTGGQLVTDGAGRDRLEPSAHSAIDNCSWLSLSVDYTALAAAADGHSVYTERLGKCLKYTILQYVKDLGFSDNGCDPQAASCPPRRTYRGTHYFQNAFKDPYIEPSALQESSYHLEATMGLILGLIRFAEANPAHPDAQAFLDQSQTLWAGAQAFVRDHGFVYSSQRIQDLSARLVSSTAIVWFIDVYDHLNGDASNQDRPLRAYDRMAGAASKSERKVAEAWQNFQASSGQERVESGHTEPEGRPYTLLKDQALATIVASNGGDERHAEALAMGLLSMHDDGFFGTVLRETGEPLAGPHPNLQTQMLGYYAWAWFLHRFGENKHKKTLTKRLNTALGAHIEQQAGLNDGPLQGLFRKMQDPSVAQLDDNLMAYFTLHLWASTPKSEETRASFQSHLDALTGSLEDLCGLTDGRSPARWAETSGTDRSPHSARFAFAPCSLFAAHLGSYEAALALFEADQALWPPKSRYAGDSAHGQTEPQTKPAETPQSNTFESTLFFRLLARRAVGALDPRQNEIARVGLVADASNEAPGALSHALLILLTDNPKGAFGTKGSALTRAQYSQGFTNLAGTHRGHLTRALADRFLDTLTALLASDFHRLRFDALLAELVALDRAYHEVQQRPSPGSLVERVLAMQYNLTRGLCDTDLLVHQASIRLDEALGMPCHTVMTMVGHLFRARGSLGDDGWIAASEYDFSSPSYKAVLNDVVQAHPNREAPGAIVAPHDAHEENGETLPEARGVDTIHLGTPNGPEAPTSYAYLRGAEPLSLSADASVIEMRLALRSRMNSAFEQGLKQTHSSAPVHYALQGLDPIDAFNPHSNHYWKRTARELRWALSVPVRARVQFTLHGQPISPPAFPLSPNRAKNVRAFRRWINQSADGDLGLLGERAQVLPEHRARWLTAMHRAIRTGEMLAPEIDALLHSLKMESTEMEAWKQPFTFEASPFASIRNVNSSAPAPWRFPWAPTLAFAEPQPSFAPIHDRSEDRGFAGLFELVGVSRAMDVTITPLFTRRGDFAVLKDQPQCLFHFKNNGAFETRYEVRIDGAPFGPEINLAGDQPEWGASALRQKDACGVIPDRVHDQANVTIKNLTTGESFPFLFPVQPLDRCETDTSVPSEALSELIDSQEYELGWYQNQSCGDRLVLAHKPPTALGYGPNKTQALAAVQTLRAIRTIKQALRTTSTVRGARSKGLSAEEMLGLLGGAVGVGSSGALAGELPLEATDLFWEKLRMFEKPPSGPWVQVGFVPAWEVFAESETAVRQLAIARRTPDGDWENHRAFLPEHIYALVQPAVYGGPALPLVDPRIPLFGHDITSKMAVYQYTGRVAVYASPSQPGPAPIFGPGQAFVHASRDFHQWILNFPPEFHYPIYFSLFIEPTLQVEGGAQSQKRIAHNRPGLFRVEGDDVLFQNIRFQRQPSMPMELQQPGYVWGEWPENGWHLYGPPQDIDTFLTLVSYSAAGKKAGAGGTPPAEDQPTASHSDEALTPNDGSEDVPPPKEQPREELLTASDSEKALRADLVAVHELLRKYHGPYRLWRQAREHILAMESLLAWFQKKTPALVEVRRRTDFDFAVADILAEIPTIVDRLDQQTLDYRVDALSDVTSLLRAFLDLTQKGSLLYEGSVILSPSNDWAGTVQGHVVFGYLPHALGTMRVMTGDQDAIPLRAGWLLSWAQYFGQPKPDFSDVDAWVQDSVIPGWGGSVRSGWGKEWEREDILPEDEVLARFEANQPPWFYVTGEDWSRKYSRDGRFIEAVSTTEANLRTAFEVYSFPAIEPRIVASIFNLNPGDVFDAGTAPPWAKDVLRAAKITKKPQIAIAIETFKDPQNPKNRVYLIVSADVADRVLEGIGRYRYLGSASHHEDEAAQTYLEAVGKRYAPKVQKEAWYITTPNRTTMHGGSSEVLSLATEEDIGALGMEVLKRFVSVGALITASKNEITPSELVNIAEQQGSRVHLLFLPAGNYWVVMGSRQEDTERIRSGTFPTYRYIGFADRDWLSPSGASDTGRYGKSYVPDGQTESWFAAARDALPPYWYTIKGQRIREKSPVLRFILQQQDPPEFPFTDTLLVGYDRNPLLAYVYSEQYGYVVFPEADRNIWADIESHAYRVLGYGTGQREFQPGGGRFYTPKVFNRLKNRQDYVFITTVTENGILQTQSHDADGRSRLDPKFARDREGRWGARSLFSYPGLVLQKPSNFKINHHEVPIADAPQTQAWWEAKLLEWFEQKTKNTRLKRTSELELTMRAMVPRTVRFQTNRGPLTLGWNASIEPDEDIVDELKFELDIE